MKKYLLYTLILILSVFLLTGCTKKDIEYDSSKIDLVGSDNQEEEQPEKEESKDSESEDLGYLSNPEEYTKTKQSIGVESEFEYTINSLEDTSKSGYHAFTFNISSTEEASLPYIVVDPVLDKGVYRVTLRNIVEDSSGLEYQKSKEVNKGAITGIYRAVTSLKNTSIYEIGFLGSNLFKLEYEEAGENSWNVVVKVSYDLKYSPPNVDFGSTEFSNEVQKISGMEASDGARISTYSYSVSGGVLKFVFSVASGTSNPIPTVQAEYDEENILVVEFPSLTSDKVTGWGSTITLPAGITVEVSRAGESSTYEFKNIGGKNEYRLSATQSPNQVIVEIKI
jgi:hypothetical protein